MLAVARLHLGSGGGGGVGGGAWDSLMAQSGGVVSLYVVYTVTRDTDHQYLAHQRVKESDADCGLSHRKVNALQDRTKRTYMYPQSFSGSP